MPWEARCFSGTVSRMGESEDPTTRTMRVEIDLANPKGLLREGMYGTATIVLEPVSRNLTVPPACVMEHSGQTHGVVYLVRDGLAHRTPVELGADNGSLVEILSGIKHRAIPLSCAPACRWKTGSPSSRTRTPAPATADLDSLTRLCAS